MNKSLDKFNEIANTVESELATLGSGKTTCEKIAQVVAEKHNLHGATVIPVVAFYLKYRGGVVIKRGRNGGLSMANSVPAVDLANTIPTL